jgi:2-iminobutanoate/2-iminopropanoate deaminase
VTKKIVETGKAPKPVGAYSQAVRAGNFLFVAGQLGMDPQSGKLAADDIATQTRRALDNITAILDAEAYSLSEVVQANVYLSSVELFKDFNREYGKYFPTEPPARVTVVATLGLGALVEISVIAYKA